jgi:nicotinate-nucleotide pyrophosphorylase (carboxylating)
MKWSDQTLRLIDMAIAEDLGSAGDITAALLDAPEVEIIGRIVPRQSGVICGLGLLPTICRHFSRRVGTPLVSSPRTEAEGAQRDGQCVEAGRTVATAAGDKAAVLAAERTILNFLGRMSGVATLTRCYVEAARRANPNVRVLDTRKTIPGWRELDKYAVRSGGGVNHRAGLYDAILIKDNHLAGVPPSRLAKFLDDLLSRRSQVARFVEVEVDGLEQFREVCKVAGVDLILLDNFSVEQMRQAVRLRDELGLKDRIELEVSGGVTLESVSQIAATGVERISVGALTHSAPSLDVGLDLESR